MTKPRTTYDAKVAYWERRLEAVAPGYAQLPAEHRRILTPAFAFMHDAQRQQVSFHFALESAFYQFGKGRAFARSAFGRVDRRMSRTIRTAYSEFVRIAGGQSVDTRTLRRTARRFRFDVNRAFMRVRTVLERACKRGCRNGVRRLEPLTLYEVAQALGISETEAEYRMRLSRIPHFQRRGAIYYALPSGFLERFANHRSGAT